MAILLLSSASPWASVPVLDWMNAAHHDDLPERLAVIVASALAWSAAGLAGYAAGRRNQGGGGGRAPASRIPRLDGSAAWTDHPPGRVSRFTGWPPRAG